MVEPDQGALVAVKLAGLFDSSVGAACGEAGFVGGQALVTEVVFEKGEVGGDFALQLGFAAGVGEEAEELGDEAAQVGRHFAGQGLAGHDPGLLGEQAFHEAGHASPARGFFGEGFLAGLGDGVEAGFAVGFGLGPGAFDPSILLEPDQGGVEGSLVRG